MARAVLHATDTRCLRCNTLPALGEASHATSSFVDGAYPTTWWEATLVLPILAAPEGQVHILQFVIELHVLSTETVDMCVRAAALPSTCSEC